jgi:hypothetical protein
LFGTFHFISEDQLLFGEMLLHTGSHIRGEAKFIPSFRVVDLIDGVDPGITDPKYRTAPAITEFALQQGLGPHTLKRLSFVRNAPLPGKADSVASMNAYLQSHHHTTPLLTNGPYYPDPKIHLVGVKFEFRAALPDAVFVGPLEEFTQSLAPWRDQIPLVARLPPSLDFHLNGQKAIWRELQGNASVIKCRDFTDHKRRTDTIGMFRSPVDPNWLTRIRIGDPYATMPHPLLGNPGTIAETWPQPGVLKMIVYQDYIILIYVS